MDLVGLTRAGLRCWTLDGLMPTRDGLVHDVTGRTTLPRKPACSIKLARRLLCGLRNLGLGGWTTARAGRCDGMVVLIERLRKERLRRIFWLRRTDSLVVSDLGDGTRVLRMKLMECPLTTLIVREKLFKSLVDH